jgi:hypothetical protein
MSPKGYGFILAHGNTFVFLFHDLNNFRTPFLRLLSTKSHYEVIMNIPVSALTETFRDFLRAFKEVLLP